MKKQNFFEKFKSNFNHNGSKNSSLNNTNTSSSSNCSNNESLSSIELKEENIEIKPFSPIESNTQNHSNNSTIIEKHVQIDLLETEIQDQIPIRKPQLRIKKKTDSKINLANRFSAHLSLTSSLSNNSSNHMKRYSTDLNAKEIAYIYKVLIIGNSGVGKTSVMNRFCDNIFMPNYIDTIGIDYKTKIIKLKPDFVNNNQNHNLKSSKRNSALIYSNNNNSNHCNNNNNNNTNLYFDNETLKVKLQIWDTAGAQRFQAITRNYYRGANGILLVYDVTDRKSFECIKTWMKSISDYCTDNVEIFLVANKCDINFNDTNQQQQRKVSQLEGESLANIYGLKYIETSAKVNINIDRAFLELTKNIRKKIEKIEISKQESRIELKKIEQTFNRKKRHVRLKLNSKRKLSNLFNGNSVLACFICK